MRPAARGTGGRVAGRRERHRWRRRRHRRHRLAERLQLLRHRRQPDVGLVGLLAQDPRSLGDAFDDELLIGERLLLPAGVGVEPHVEGLERIAQPEQDRAELLLFLLQHPNLCHEQLVLLIGVGARRRGASRPTTRIPAATARDFLMTHPLGKIARYRDLRTSSHRVNSPPVTNPPTSLYHATCW